MRIPLYVAGLILLGLLAAPGLEVTVDFAKPSGNIRPLHGVNLGPLCYRGTVDLSPYHRELRIPYTRLHDVVWIQADAVDISTIFRDFKADPTIPESYSFATTDDYIQAIVNVGSGIVYRLGESIEHTSRKYRVHPPAEPAKWAEICAGIVRHYNEGWAGGYRHNIRYWEIWNEPDVRPAMWTGNDTDFFNLFEVTAKHLKSRFPRLKVGGPGLGGTGDFVEGEFRPTAFCTNFLAYCRDHSVALDFVSWHRYTSDPWDLPLRARAMRAVLNQYGFTNAESHFNEWNYLPHDDWRPMLKEGQGKLREAWYEEMGGPAGAAFALCGLILLQDAPVDVANFYTGEIQGFGLFTYHGTPKKTYYAFKAFADVQALRSRVNVDMSAPQQTSIAALAALDSSKQEAAVAISKFRESDSPARLVIKNLPWERAGCELYAIDANHELSKIGSKPLPASLELDLPAPSVVLVRIKPAAQ